MYEFEAIGTHWWLERLDGSGFSNEIQDIIQKYTAEFDQRYSRFRDDSLVAELARNGVIHNPPSEMLDMLAFARTMFEATDGVFSPFVGNDLENLGYGKQLNNHANVNTKQLKRWNLFSSGVTWNSAAVHADKGTVLDFGGFGKGWMIDEYVKILQAHGLKKFIVNGGGDLFVQSDTPVEIALEDPRNATKKFGSVKIQQGALAASSTMKRSWENGDTRHHHIIDPIAGKPSESDVVASFVLADTALVADTLATILIISPELEKKLTAKFNVQTRLIHKIAV